MSNYLRIKRRTAGSPDAPTTLLNAELAFIEVNDVLYYGKGTGGAGGSATTIIPIGGSGAFMTLTSAQTISGDKTFSGNVSLGALATATTHTTAENSSKIATTAWVKSLPTAASTASYITVNSEATLDNERSLAGSSDITIIDNGANNTITVNLANTTVTPGTYPKVTVDAKGRVTNASALAESDVPAEIARLASPSFSGTPTAPTATGGTNTNQIATTSFVKSEIASLIGSAPGTLDTLNEIAAALGDDPNFVTTITTSIGSKLAKDANLSDLASPTTARQNLGLIIGTHVQAQSAKLQSIADLTLAVDTGIYATGTSSFATFSLTTFGRSLVGAAANSNARTTLGLGTIATQNANAVAITGGTIDNIEFDGGTI